MRDYVFGYASLVADPTGFAADLSRHRRAWTVSMDNARDVPGYKFYVDRESGERPAAYVTFLDLVADADASVNGMVLPIRDRASLDARERNYERRDVTDLLSERPPDGRVWAYFGTPEAHERHAAGIAAGRAVVQRAYLDGVRAGFARLGAGELDRFDGSTEPPGIPIRDLERVDLPPG